MADMTLGQKIAKQLIEEIVRGDLRPGERLDEQTLADRFQVSRSPIRDALRELLATRLVEQAPRRGVSVAAVNRDELRDLFDAWSELEALCARYCALRADTVERARLQHLLEQGAAAVDGGDTEGYSEANRQLHRAIYDACHNSALREMTLDLRRRLSGFRARSFFTGERIAASQQEHKMIVAAILDHDAGGAARAMKDHIAHTALSIVQQIAPPADAEPVPSRRAGGRGLS